MDGAHQIQGFFRSGGLRCLKVYPQSPRPSEWLSAGIFPDSRVEPSEHPFRPPHAMAPTGRPVAAPFAMGCLRAVAAGRGGVATTATERGAGGLGRLLERR